MHKKIDSALRDLTGALEKHARRAADSETPRGKLRRAEAEVRAAATHYAALLYAKTGAESPFTEVPDPRLDAPTVASLRAERDALSRKLEAAEAERSSRKRSKAEADAPVDEEPAT